MKESKNGTEIIPDCEENCAGDSTPCFLAATPFVLLAIVLFYYVFKEDYDFQWTIVLICSGCAVLAPAVLFIMVGLKCVPRGHGGRLNNNVPDKKSGFYLFSKAPNLEWRQVTVQSNQPALPRMTYFDYGEDDRSDKTMEVSK